jgi:hypothetical protein
VKDMKFKIESKQETDDRVIAHESGAVKKEALARVIAILKATGEKDAIAAAELVAKQYGGALKRLAKE